MHGSGFFSYIHYKNTNRKKSEGESEPAKISKKIKKFYFIVPRTFMVPALGFCPVCYKT